MRYVVERGGMMVEVPDDDDEATPAARPRDREPTGVTKAIQELHAETAVAKEHLTRMSNEANALQREVRRPQSATNLKRIVAGG